MRYRLMLMCLLGLATMKAQTVDNYLISAAGDAIMSGDGALYLSVGEPMDTELTDGEVMISQGFLQITVEGNILNNEELLTEHIKIFPNPTVNEIQLGLAGDLSEYSYRLYDIHGNTITEKIQLTTSRISMSSYPAGVYLLTLHKRATSSKSLRIIKQ